MVLPSEITEAALSGQPQQVIKWLKKGGQVDALAEGRCGLLHVAAIGGSLRVAKELLQRGANVDLRAAKGWTALMLAAGRGQPAMVRLLLEHKANINLQSGLGSTALMWAAAKGSMECVQELLEAGASTVLRDQEGNSAVEQAEANTHTATAELLRQHAAKPPAAAAARGAAKVAAKAATVALTEGKALRGYLGADANGDFRTQYEEFVTANRARLRLDEGGGELPKQAAKTGRDAHAASKGANQNAMNRAQTETDRQLGV